MVFCQLYFFIRNKFAVSPEGFTLQNQDSMESYLHKKLVLYLTSLGKSIITKIRERNFAGLLRIKKSSPLCTLILHTVLKGAVSSACS